MEEYFNQKYSQIRDTRLQTMRDQQIVQQMQQKIVGDVKLTPSDVRRYFNQLPKDSLPNIPLSVEAEIITMEPKIPIEEIDAIKARLREFTAEVDSGKISFAALATLYSDDKESAKRGGELGFMGKADLLPAFANVAFNLTDPKKVSNIVETEYGYHIIQLIEKRGDRINVRHILLRPRVSDKELAAATNRMDSLYDDIMAKKFSFEDAATYVSADKETRNNKGLMVNKDMNSTNYSTPRFEMQELPPEVAKAIDTMKVGSISKPFTMINDKSKEVVAIVKLMARTPAHKANLADDYLMLKNRAEAKQKQEILDKWIADKQKTTYIRIAPGWGQCKFKYPGWIKK
jgi:peptidyl-prolyl cis-trans isomerase SurA